MLQELEKALYDSARIKSVLKAAEISIKTLCSDDEKMDIFDHEICLFISLLHSLCAEWMNHQRKIVLENTTPFFHLSTDELDLDDEADFEPEGGEE